MKYLVRSDDVSIALFILVSSVPSSSEAYNETSYWADKIIDYSSQFDNTRFAAHQVIGPPNVYPEYSDKEGTWAQYPNARDNQQFIEVGFPEALKINKIEIYETYNAGGVRRISGRMSNNQWQVLYHNDTVSVIHNSRIFSPPVPDVSCPMDALRIDVDCTASRSYVEIDAVRIGGIKPEVNCIQGKWGQCCERMCETCWENYPCNKTTGICPIADDDYRCAPGYKGESCDQVCKRGTYGADCLKSCGHCAGGIDQCAIEYGICPPIVPRCQPGYKGELCRDTCNSGEYGADCAMECGQCLVGPCSSTSGQCAATISCLPGYVGDLCQTECSPETWGDKCSNNCSINCKTASTQCYPHNGSCTRGCQDGFGGYRCLTRLEGKEEMGPALIGGVVGFLVGVTLSFIVILIVWKFRLNVSGRKRPAKQNDNNRTHESFATTGGKIAYDNRQSKEISVYHTSTDIAGVITECDYEVCDDTGTLD